MGGPNEDENWLMRGEEAGGCRQMRRPWPKQDSTALEVFEEGRTVKCGPAVALML